MAISSRGSLVKLCALLLYYTVVTVGTLDVIITVNPLRPRIGETVALICIYSPRSSVQSFSSLQWYRQGTEIANFSCPIGAKSNGTCDENVLNSLNDARISFKGDADYSANLTISDLQKSDSGNYTCVISTDAGVEQNTTQLHVAAPTEEGTTLVQSHAGGDQTEKPEWPVSTDTTFVDLIRSSDLLVYFLIGALGLALLILFLIGVRWLHVKIRACGSTHLEGTLGTSQKEHTEEAAAPSALLPMHRRYPGTNKPLPDNPYDSIPDSKGSLNQPRYHSSLGTDTYGYALVPDPLAGPSAFSRYTAGETGVIDDHGYMVPNANIAAAK